MEVTKEQNLAKEPDNKWPARWENRAVCVILEAKEVKCFKDENDLLCQIL